MDIRLFVATFVSIFLAELGDKTQLATMSLTTQNLHSKWIIFGGASLALVLTSLIGVLFGDAITRVVPPKVIRISAAILFIGIGIFMLASKDEPQRYGLLIRELNRYKAAQTTDCTSCEKFQTALKTFREANDPKLTQAVGFFSIHPDQWRKAKGCPDCSAEKLGKTFRAASVLEPEKHKSDKNHPAAT